MILYILNNDFYHFLIAVCFPPCKNGGTCKKPDQCECKNGFEGLICQFGKYSSSSLILL